MGCGGNGRVRQRFFRHLSIDGQPRAELLFHSCQCVGHEYRDAAGVAGVGLFAVECRPLRLQSRHMAARQRPCQPSRIAALCRRMAQAFRPLAHRRGVAQHLAFYIARNAGFRIAAVACPPIHVQLGKHFADQRRIGQGHRYFVVAARQIRFSRSRCRGRTQRPSEQQHRRRPRVVGLAGRQHRLLRHPAAPWRMACVQNPACPQFGTAAVGQTLLPENHPPVADRNRRR